MNHSDLYCLIYHNKNRVYFASLGIGLDKIIRSHIKDIMYLYNYDMFAVEFDEITT